tara:strand:- start:312 stop:458 length:147 start_codon:yes stop_codon:yes gene_type:complete
MIKGNKNETKKPPTRQKVESDQDRIQTYDRHIKKAQASSLPTDPCWGD